MRRLSTVVAVVVCVLGPGRLAAQKGNSTKITAEDIVNKAGNIQTAWDAVSRIRPNFFRLPPTTELPGSASSSQPSQRPERSLFVDEILFDRVDNLKEIPAADVFEIRLLSQADVVLFFGKQGHPFGAISVTTKRKAGVPLK